MGVQTDRLYSCLGRVVGCDSIEAIAIEAAIAASRLADVAEQEAARRDPVSGRRI